MRYPSHRHVSEVPPTLASVNVSPLLAGSSPELNHHISGHSAAVFTSIPCALAHSRTSVVFTPPGIPRRLPRTDLRVLPGRLRRAWPRTSPRTGAVAPADNEAAGLRAR
jgi:hypothetical protein